MYTLSMQKTDDLRSGCWHFSLQGLFTKKSIVWECTGHHPTRNPWPAVYELNKTSQILYKVRCYSGDCATSEEQLHFCL